MGDPDRADFAGLSDPLFAEILPHQRRALFRRRVWERDGGLCGLCGTAVPFGPTMHLDHILPFAQGGATHWCNLRATHQGCNQRRKRVIQAPWDRLDGRKVAGTRSLRAALNSLARHT